MLISLLALVQRVLRFAERRDSLRRAKRAGMVVGSGTRFVGSQDFGTEPHLVEFGRDCLITEGVKFITHDGAIQVPLIRSGESATEVYARKSVFGKIKVGDNCFIGLDSIILLNSEIGNNCIVGSGSVVRGVFPDDCVIAGVPARVIGSIDHYFEKSQDRIIQFTGSESVSERADIICTAISDQS